MRFGHENELAHLRQTGKPGTARVLSMKTLAHETTAAGIRAPDEDLAVSWSDCWMKLAVTPDDETIPPFEATVLTRIHTFKWQGSTVPVWFDPADHSTVLVDYEADLAAQSAPATPAGFAEDKLMHRFDQRLGLAWAPVAGDLYPLAVIASDGSGQLEVTGHVGGLMTEPAQAAVSYVRGDLTRLVPGADPSFFAGHDLHVDQPYTHLPASVEADEVASVGLAIAAALASLLGGHMVRPDVALSGAVGSDGGVLAVPGVQDKVRAAQGDAARLILPAVHQHEVKVPHGLEVIFVSHVAEALKACLTKRPMKRTSS